MLTDTSPSPASALQLDTMTNLAAPSYLDVATAIGYQFARTALWDADRCNWLGSALEAQGGSYQITERTQGPHFYSGTAGVALFLAHLVERQTAPDPVLIETLEGAVRHVLSSDITAPDAQRYGYYTGELGLAATLIAIGEQRQRPDWQEVGWQRLEWVCNQPIQPAELDVLAGVAGAIPVLIRLYARQPRPFLHEALLRCGDFLVTSALKTDTVWTWTAIPGQPPLTGYSHGAAGIALGLLELYAVSGNPLYFSGAMAGFNFERIHFNPQVQNWPDFRVLQPAGSSAAPAASIYNEAWCHGAPGIALSRLRAWQLTQEPTFRQEAEVALNTTWRHLYAAASNPAAPANFSLCHGLAGNADIMLEGARILDNPQYAEVARQVGDVGIVRFHNQGLNWPSGVNDPTGATPGMGETPGLMLGLAGTGYFYLRLAFPVQVPSVLMP